MIVQSAAVGDRHMVLTMEQHTATGGVLAEHFGGTAAFAPLEPRELMVGLVHEHDRGWVEVDESAPADPSTGLPWSVYETPVAISVATGPRSIDHNERCHPFRGLLASMHIVGLSTGRYGLSDDRALDAMDPASRRLLEPVIDAEHERQARLRRELADDGRTARWLADDVLMRDYKALQFFDRLALWLQVSHPSRRRPVRIDHVPTHGVDHVTVTVTPLDDTRVALDPYPFDVDPLELVIEGRWLEPSPPGSDLAAALADAAPARQPVVLCAA